MNVKGIAWILLVVLLALGVVILFVEHVHLHVH